MDASSPTTLASGQEDDDPGSSPADPAPLADRSSQPPPNSPATKPSLLASVQSWVAARFRGKSNADVRQSLEDLVETDLLDGKASLLGEDERTMLRNILTYHEVRVDDVMVPHADITAFEDSGSFDDLVQLFVKAGHSRIPVYQDRLDNIMGMIHIKDLVAALVDRKTPAPDLSTFVRSVLFVPPSMRVIDLLARMRAARVHMAIVVDEFGGTDGLVTIEDLVEEIVGEIEDEHDQHEPDPLTKVAMNEWLADARVPIEDLERATGLTLREDEDDMDVDTLGGLVFALSGKVPAIGDQVHHEAGLLLEVIDGDPRRITRVRISRAQSPAISD